LNEQITTLLTDKSKLAAELKSAREMFELEKSVLEGTTHDLSKEVRRLEVACAEA
jgi:hypothetical protein